MKCSQQRIHAYYKKNDLFFFMLNYIDFYDVLQLLLNKRKVRQNQRLSVSHDIPMI